MKFILWGIFLFLIIFFISFFFISQSKAEESIILSVSPASSGVVSSVVSGENEGLAVVPNSSEDPLRTLRGIPEASTFVSLLDETGVTAQLSSNGLYTFFVPTNEAFAASPIGPLEDLSPAERLRLARFHIVSGEMMSLTAVKSGYMPMSSGDELNLNVFDVSIIESNTRVLATYTTPDGIIYLIDHVLQPPEYPPFPI